MINPTRVKEFFMVTAADGIYLWKYDQALEKYYSTQMIDYSSGGAHRRGEMNEVGIYVVGGRESKNAKT